ncbi:MAG TPA: hypothetical protein VFJ77_08380 [Gaiellaceae bacterium]|nr:hypothetical protein [Gaiellaceae bacterium]
MPTVPAFLSARAMRILNVAAAIWAAFWIAVAAGVGYEVNALRTLSDTVVESGRAVQTTGDALGSLGGIPFVGSQLRPLADEIAAAGASAQTSGASSKTTIDALAVLLGIAVGLIPTVPLLALYLPLRRSWKRDRAAVARAVAQWDGEPGLDEFLARRALAHLPYHELRELSRDGGRAFEDDARGRLAAAELHRLGLDRQPRRLLGLRRRRERVGR